jgi:sulfhydrogenase subunit alpha
MKTRTVKVDYLARVEGEGGLYIKVQNQQVVDVQLRIFEPPRLFEAFLRGRGFQEAPDITARICGICPVAYQMSAVHAMENAFGVKVGGQLRALRRLLYCGEWIESHTLHVYMLHAPDFLGYASAIEMAKDHPEMVQRGLKLKKIGNEIIRVLGGRAIHPINVRVGGFYKAPSKRELASLAESLKWAQDAALETLRWVSAFTFPDFEPNYLFVSLRHPDEYPFNEGRLVSSENLNIGIESYDQYFSEQQVKYSTALHSVLRDASPYFVGPLARYSLNFDRLPASVQQAAREAGLDPVCRNPFQSIVVRSLEIFFACTEAMRIIEEYDVPEKPAIDVEVRSGTGYGCTEAPRGTLYHRYRIDEHGTIVDAKIVPPTSQNQRVIEQDLRQFATQFIELPQEKLQWQCEQAVRNYDPCISCSTHFLKLNVERM